LVKVSMAVSPACVLAWRAVSAVSAWAARGGWPGSPAAAETASFHHRV